LIPAGLEALKAGKLDAFSGGENSSQAILATTDHTFRDRRDDREDVSVPALSNNGRRWAAFAALNDARKEQEE
jgi:hypothetical protein